jgi:hypothetical protein
VIDFLLLIWLVAVSMWAGWIIRDCQADREWWDEHPDRCFCPGGGAPDGLNHRPGCPLGLTDERRSDENT